MDVDMRVRVRGFNKMEQEVYPVVKSCTYNRWASREILCERNYMEVKPWLVCHSKWLKVIFGWLWTESLNYSCRFLLIECQGRLLLCVGKSLNWPERIHLISGPALFLRYGGSILILSPLGTLIWSCPLLAFQAITSKYNIWRMVFFTPEQKAMVLEDALKAGHGITTTKSRLAIRSGYDMPETYVENVSARILKLALIVFLS